MSLINHILFYVPLDKAAQQAMIVSDSLLFQNMMQRAEE